MPEWMDISAFNFGAALLSLGFIAAFALAGWIASLVRKDVSIVDSMWSLMFLLSLGVYIYAVDHVSWRGLLVLVLATIWALRLSVHIIRRSQGEPEDRRYQEIRANHQPNFRLKSIYIVFGLQALLAWLISMPLLAAASKASGLGWLDGLGVVLWATGMYFEWMGDAQLARFRRNPANRGKVLNRGLWRYTRHPNYFGEFLLQWGFFMFAAAAGGLWTIFAPLLITFLLLRVSGVALLERHMEERRPEYREYIISTNAFFPGRPRPGPDYALFIALCLSITLPFPATPLHADEASRVWEFEVLVDDKPVGHHRFFLDRDGSTQNLRSIADFEYRLLFLKLYDYEHVNNEVWHGSCLGRIDSSTDANGKEYSVAGRRESGRFVVENGQQSQFLPECVKTFAYWDPAFLAEPRLLNSQTGEYMKVEVTAPIADDLEVRGVTLPTQRYHLVAGEFEIDLWYTADEEWVGLRTKSGEGRSLRYVLQ